jgi:hypothetical protein
MNLSYDRLGIQKAMWGKPVHLQYYQHNFLL